MSSLTVALIAGGRSKRFGSDKAFAKWGREDLPLWEVQLQKLEALNPDNLLISANPDQDFGERSVLLDEIPDLGPLGGLAACFAAAKTDLLLVLAVDMPQMTVEFLQSLRSQVVDGCGVVPQLGKFWEPLAAIYPTSLKEAASQQLKEDDRSLQSFVRKAEMAQLLKTVQVSPKDEELFRSMNFAA